MRDEPLLGIFRQALSQTSRPWFRVKDVEVFPGPSPYCRVPAIVCHSSVDQPVRLSDLSARLESKFHVDLQGRGSSEPTVDSALFAALLAELAAQLGSTVLNLSLDRGTAEAANGDIVSWTEYFPGGNNYDGAWLCALAHQVALVELAACAYGEENSEAVAIRCWDELRQASPRFAVDSQSLYLINVARARRLPILPAGRPHCWQFGWGARSKIFWQASSNADGFIGFQVQKNKFLTKALLESMGLPTPRWRAIEDDVAPAAKAVGFPLVVKPHDGGQGRGITTNIRSESELDRAIALARNFSDSLLIEAQEAGDDHRLTVIDYRLVSAVRRTPPMVVGDGRRTIRELISAENQSRSATKNTRHLYPIVEDQALVNFLTAQGLTLDSIPDNGEQVVLRSTANHSLGGEVLNVINEIHPHTREMAELIARAFSIRAAGIDYITTDISRPHSEVGGTFIEVNTTPGLTVIEAAGIDAAEIGAWVLGAGAGRVPVSLLICTDELLDEAMASASELLTQSPGIAATSAGWAQIGTVMLPGATNLPMSNLYQLLRHRAVAGIATIWTPAMIYEFGLPADRFEKVVMLNENLDDRWLKLVRSLADDISSISDLRTAVEVTIDAIRPGVTQAGTSASHLGRNS